MIRLIMATLFMTGFFLMLQHEPVQARVQKGEPAQHLAAFPLESLSAKEREGILLLREEEKLAYDVYLALYERWGLQPFRNIASSEKQHMRAMKELVNRYKLKDPADRSPRGVFQNRKLQKLYQELVEKGSKSRIDALKVGATIEELDIKDLQESLAHANNRDIVFVYRNLLKGSRNHLRAFYRNIRREGGDYAPVYMSRKAFDAIVNSPKERGAAYR